MEKEQMHGAFSLNIVRSKWHKTVTFFNGLRPGCDRTGICTTALLLSRQRTSANKLTREALD